MEIEVHHFFHYEETSGIKSTLDKILQIVQKIQIEEAAQMVDLTELKATTAATNGAVESTKIVIDSAIATFNEILAKLENTVDPAEIAAVVAEGKAYTAVLLANRDALAAAVAEFTPPPPPAP